MADTMADICMLAAKGTTAWKTGDFAQAKEIFVSLCEKDAKSLLWPSLLARAHLAEGDAAQAFSICDDALGGRRPEEVQSSNHSELLLTRGRARIGIAAAEDARADLSRVVSLGGLGADAKRELGEAFTQLGLPVPTFKTVVVPKSKPKPAAKAPAASMSAPSSAVAPSPKPSATPKASASASKAPAPPTAAVDAAKAAVKFEQQDQFLKAKEQCTIALTHQAGLPAAVLCLARMALRSGNEVEVNQLLRKKYPSIMTAVPHCVEALALLASASEKAGDWEDAADDLEAALRHRRSGSSNAKPSLSDLQGRLAKAKWKAGDRQAASSLAQNVLDSGDTTQREACEVACAILLERGDNATALAAMLRCLIGHRDEPSSASADLVCGVMKRCSVEELAGTLAPDLWNGGAEKVDKDNRASIAEVLAYVGLIMKERSEVLPACQLYRTAVYLAPSHASLCLNLMHTYSLRNDNLRAVAWGARYFKHLSASVPAALIICSLLFEPGAGDTESTVALDPSNFGGNKNAFYDAIAIGFALVKLLYLAQPHKPILGGSKDESDAGPAPLPWQQQLLGLDIEKESNSGTQSVKPFQWKQDAATADAHLSVLKGLCQVLEKSRSGRDLHLTSVRNEHAYFACVADIVASPSSPACESSSGKLGGSIFVIGDSHVLSNAWQTICLPSAGGAQEPHLLVPCLVTGVKIWHLQGSSTFYTKYAFWNRIESLPSAAPVILMMGEIDCREGVLKAVQLDRHGSIKDALVAIVDLYLIVLKEVRRRVPRSQVFIHPVPNVLPETRFLTLAFNELLVKRRDKLEKMGIKLLEMAPVLKEASEGVELSADSSQNPMQLAKWNLLPGLELDGTHINPAYVRSHLAPALEKVWKQPEA